jgi:hypothetical protein
MADPRNLRAYVSAYQPDRVHVTRLGRGDVVRLSADFNGAVAAGLTIESVIWRCLNPWAAKMAEVEIDDRSTSVGLTAQWGCGAALKCEATFDDGSKATQLFRVYVRTAPWFYQEPTTWAQGPYDLAATA